MYICIYIYIYIHTYISALRRRGPGPRAADCYTPSLYYNKYYGMPYCAIT